MLVAWVVSPQEAFSHLAVALWPLLAEVPPLLFSIISCVSFFVSVLAVIFEASGGSPLLSRSCADARFVIILQTLVFILWLTMVFLYLLSLLLLLDLGDFFRV